MSGFIWSQTPTFIFLALLWSPEEEKTESENISISKGSRQKTQLFLLRQVKTTDR